MAEDTSLRRSNRLLVAMFALIGSVVGFYWLFALSEPEKPVSIVVSSYTQPGPQPPATLTVKFFGRVGYTRSAPNSTAFHTEVMFWQLAPLLAAIVGGALGGGLVGYMVGRWLPRTHY